MQSLSCSMQDVVPLPGIESESPDYQLDYQVSPHNSNFTFKIFVGIVFMVFIVFFVSYFCVHSKIFTGY